jgi:protein-disulfide isomerase-like protein with CxxC motif
VAVAVIVAGAVLLAGCGSSKPSYCSSLTSLEQSVKAIPATDLVKNGTSALKTNVDKVVSNAHAVVNAAKKDFPTETGAIKTAIDSLQTTVNQLEKGASPTLVVQTAGNVASLATSVKNFSSAASSKCK